MSRFAFCLVLCGCRIHFAEIDPRTDDAANVVCGGTPVPASGVISGTLGAGGGTSGSCGGDDVLENMWTIDVPVDGSQLIAAADSNASVVDSMLYIRTQCTDGASELVCDHDSGIGPHPAYRLTNVNAGRYYVFIDGQDGNTGTYAGTINVLLPANASCNPATPRERCGPELDCPNGTCVPFGCGAGVTLSGALSYTRMASTNGLGNDHAGSCGQGNDGGARAPEGLYDLVLASAVSNVNVSIDTNATSFDTLIYMRAGCAGAEIACDDDSGLNNTSTFDTGPSRPARIRSSSTDSRRRLAPTSSTS